MPRLLFLASDPDPLVGGVGDCLPACSGRVLDHARKGGSDVDVLFPRQVRELAPVEAGFLDPVSIALLGRAVQSSARGVGIVPLDHDVAVEAPAVVPARFEHAAAADVQRQARTLRLSFQSGAHALVERLRRSVHLQLFGLVHTWLRPFSRSQFG